VPKPTTLRPKLEAQNLLNDDYNYDYDYDFDAYDNEFKIISPLGFIGSLLLLVIGIGLVVLFYNICSPESSLCFFGSFSILCVFVVGAFFLLHTSGKYTFYFWGFSTG
jgi:hypothetical protein